MSRTSRVLASIFLAVLVAWICGCGGGSGSSGADGRISGRVSGSTGRASADQVTVSIDGTNLSTEAAADGTFAIDHVPPGLHTVIAHSLLQAIAVVAEVKKGGETNVGSIEMREAGQISGLVTNKTNHQPIPFARIAVTEMVATNSFDALPHPVRVVHADGSGSYTVNGLPVGGYLVSVGAEGFESMSLSLAVGIGTTTPGDAQLNPIAATAKGTMAGIVNLVSDTGDKQPLSGVLVRLTNNNDPQPMRPLPDKAFTAAGGAVDLNTSPGFLPPFPRDYYAFSDENGAYSIDGIPAGTYTAVAVRPGLEPDTKSVTIAASGATKVDFDLKLHQFKVGIVEGIVTDSATKLPVANADVSAGFRYLPLSYTATGSGAGAGFAAPGDSIFIRPDEFTSHAVTDNKGHYQLKAPAGDRTLNVFAQGYQYHSSVITVPAGATLIADIALDPEQGLVLLTGKVLTSDANGGMKPVAGANVFAGRIDVPYAGGGTGAGSGGANGGVAGGAIARPVFLDQTTTDANGVYSFSLHAGQYGLSATKDNLYSPPMTIDLQSNMTQDLVMKPAPLPPPPNGA